MGKEDLTTTVEMLKNFTDVLYLTGEKQMPPEIKLLLKQKNISFITLPIDKFAEMLPRLDLVGTVILDAKGLDLSQQQRLARIIETLEMKGIGVILLNNRIELPVKSFSLAGPQVKSFALVNRTETISTDELWVRISLNLACRKRSSQFSVRPALPSRQEYKIYTNKLAEQLNMTGALVENLAEQLHMAGLVQRDFLPTNLPDTNEVRWAATFLPAEWVSGDIYDVARIDEQHIGFYIADAVGHAMPAALLTIFIKQALVMRETRGKNYRIFSPAEVISNLNMRMTGQKLSGYQFATCCYCMLNIKTLQLTFARAGHPYPVLIRPKQEPEQLEVRGSLLGIFEHAEYIQRTIQLAPGDKLLLYSDGAEPFIGSFNDLTGFHFSEDFYRIKDLPIIEMFDEFNLLVQSKKIDPCEVDDITMVGLEIL